MAAEMQGSANGDKEEGLGRGAGAESEELAASSSPIDTKSLFVWSPNRAREGRIAIVKTSHSGHPYGHLLIS